MQLRTAHCLNALFQRHDSNRLLNVLHSRIGVQNNMRLVVASPAEAAQKLSQILETAFSPSNVEQAHNDNRTTTPVIEFSIGGLIHDPFNRTEEMVEAVSLKFFDRRSLSDLSISERFLKGLVHCDSMPDPHGPDIGSFTAILRHAGESWSSVDFLHHIARRHAA